ncbi:hypothetical protein ACHQM5_010381 [Ranunculus cassubicifolius]
MKKPPKLDGRPLLEFLGNPDLIDNQPREFWNDLCNKHKSEKMIKNKVFKALFGKSRQIRLTEDSASIFFQLSKALGYQNCDGKTISWLMKQAQPAVQAAIAGTSTSSSSSTREEANGSTKLEEIKRGKNQIWALCDEVDGMPRLYAKMSNLLLGELKAEVTFLEPEPTTEKERKWLLEKKLPMACGRFKESTSTTAMEISEFSYPINCKEVSSDTGSSFYNIIPQKEQVWAVFKDWNVNWTLHDYMKCTRYEIVEVVSDLCEQSEIKTVCLERAGGSGTVFERKKQNGRIISRSFLKTELLQFSHRVPASKLKKEELGGHPGESWELNCAALPLNLL